MLRLEQSKLVLSAAEERQRDLEVVGVMGDGIGVGVVGEEGDEE